MIELYKIFMLKYDSDITLKPVGKCIQRQYDTRNHRFALQQSHIQGGPKKSKPLPIFQKIVLKIANEIRFLRKVKV